MESFQLTAPGEAEAQIRGTPWKNTTTAAHCINAFVKYIKDHSNALWCYLQNTVCPVSVTGYSCTS